MNAEKKTILAKKKRMQMKILGKDGCSYIVGAGNEGFENGVHYGHHGQLHPYGKRSPQEYPYNYDDYNLFVHPDKESLDNKYEASGAYTDRILHWDWDKHNEACRHVWNNEGQYWQDRTPEEIERFLNYYYDRSDFKVTKIVQSVNHSSGYPLWYIAWVCTDKIRD